jgi:hypothetical protein
MDMQENLPVKLSCRFDQYLMHLIQETTKRPSAEILAFFYELVSQVADLGAKDKMSGNPNTRTNKRSRGGIRKNIVDYFPGTSIPFHMLVKGWKHNSHEWVPDPVKGGGTYVSKGTVYQCNAEVGFPESRTYIKEEDLKAISEALMERALLDAPMDGINVPEFTKPEIQSPKMFKELMDAFAGREPEPKKSRKKKKVEDGTEPATK